MVEVVVGAVAKTFFLINFQIIYVINYIIKNKNIRINGYFVEGCAFRPSSQQVIMPIKRVQLGRIFY